MNPSQKILAKAFLQLPQPEDKIQYQYLWIDGSLRNIRCKSRTLSKDIGGIEEFPVMEFCGSATDFEMGNVADFYAKPVKFYRDPFRGGNNKLAFCETYTREELPSFANNRRRLLNAEEKARTQPDMLTFHQPYTLLRPDGKPLSYLDPAYSLESKSGFLCGREIAEAHYRACLYAGINFNSLEPLSNAGQWKYAIGPCPSVSLGDDVWVSRFILIRVAEDFGVTVSMERTGSTPSLETLSAGISFCTDSIIQQERQRIIEALFSRFILKEEKPLKILTPSDKVILMDINADVDPYSITTKVLEVVKYHD